MFNNYPAVLYLFSFPGMILQYLFFCAKSIARRVCVCFVGWLIEIQIHASGVASDRYPRTKKKQRAVLRRTPASSGSRMISALTAQHSSEVCVECSSPGPAHSATFCFLFSGSAKCLEVCTTTNCVSPRAFVHVGQLPACICFDLSFCRATHRRGRSAIPPVQAPQIS